MKHKKIDKYKIKKLPKLDVEPPVGGYTVLHEGDGELIGVCSKPGITPPAPDEVISIYCRDMILIMDISKREVINACEAILEEKRALGIHFREPHYSNMVEINFKFKQRLLMTGDIDDLTFYFKV